MLPPANFKWYTVGMSLERGPVRVKIVLREMDGGRHEFRYEDAVFIYDAACRDYDWFVAYDELPKKDCGDYRDGCETLQCPRERTLLLTQEPVSIKRYSRAYTGQFGHFLTNRPPEAERHPRYHFGQGYYAWYYDKSYDRIVSQALPPKTRVLSAVCSAKRMKYTAHDARFRLIESIAEAVPECDWFGRGVKPLGPKYEALDPYKYSLAIENHVAKGHWSEKIADVLLAEALPFYAGDPDLGKVLPPESFIRIPIDDPPEAVRIVQNAIANGEYEKRLPAIREAKRLLLTKYNVWAQILDVIRGAENQPIAPVDPAKPARLYSRRRLRRNPLVALSDGWHHLCEEVKRLCH